MFISVAGFRCATYLLFENKHIMPYGKLVSSFTDTDVMYVRMIIDQCGKKREKHFLNRLYMKFHSALFVSLLSLNID